jgi:chromosome segregation ATPase
MQLSEVRAILPQGVLEESVSNLMKQEQALALEAFGLNVREEQYREQVKAATDLLKKARPDEEILAGLNRVRESRLQTLDRLRELHKQGVITGAEIAKAEEEVAIAQMEIKEAIRDAGKASSDRLEKLNTELANVTVARMEARLKREYVGDQLAELQESLKREIGEAKPLREEIAAISTGAQEFAAEARKREAELHRLKASYRTARVEVFDLSISEDKPADTEKAQSK